MSTNRRKTTLTNESSTSLRYVRNEPLNDQKMLIAPDASLPKHSLVESESTGSGSLDRLYSSPDFIRSWDNNVSLQVAQNVIHLRTLRKLSQQQVADEMRTSQSAIARIEGGDENITLSTLKRLIHALKGHLYIAIPPQEMSFPRAVEWWSSSLTAPWAIKFVGRRSDGRTERAVLGLERNVDADVANTLPSEPALLEATAS